MMAIDFTRLTEDQRRRAAEAFAMQLEHNSKAAAWLDDAPEFGNAYPENALAEESAEDF